MNRILSHYILPVLLLVLPLDAHAAVKIHGKITDENNEPLEFVSVRVQGTALGATSGLDGTFQFSVADTDTLRILFTCVGYQEAKRKLINPKGDVTVNVKMEPASYALNAVEVTEYRKQTDGLQRLDADSYKLAPDINGGSVEG